MYNARYQAVMASIRAHSENWRPGTYVIPEHIHDGLAAYVATGRPTGSCLRAILTNDLFGAMRRADDEVMAGMPAICAFLLNYVPAGAYGSEEKVVAWLTDGGAEGRAIPLSALEPA